MFRKSLQSVSPSCIIDLEGNGDGDTETEKVKKMSYNQVRVETDRYKVTETTSDIVRYRNMVTVTLYKMTSEPYSRNVLASLECEINSLNEVAEVTESTLTFFENLGFSL